MTNERRDPEASGEREGLRLTPYELAFTPEMETQVFPAIEQEAAARGVDPGTVERFAFLSVTGDLLRDMTEQEAPPEALEQYRALLFHAFQFWRLGKSVYRLERAVARYLVEAAPTLSGWSVSLPTPAGYVQLPANLFWASVSPESTPEAVDGFFYSGTREADPLGPPYTRLEVLLVTGIHPGRAGFSVIPFDTELDPELMRQWMDAPGRDQGRDFDNVLPGGEISGLYSILTTTEALKLLARALWYVDQNPDDIVREEPPTANDSSASRLPFHRVRLGEGA